jgi:predicted ATPase
MEGSRFFRSIKLENLLSYGSVGETIELQPLNVLIGPNASGKSNLIEAFSLLRAAPLDLAGAVRTGGGVADWLWKGGGSTPVATIEATVEYPEGVTPLRYRMAFTAVGQRLDLVDEALGNERPNDLNDLTPNFYYRYRDGRPVINLRFTGGPPPLYGSRMQRNLRREDLSPEQSILAQYKDPDLYPEITYIGRQFGAIRLYRDWSLGQSTGPRQPQKTDLPTDFLMEDAANLGLILNRLEHRSGVSQKVITNLKKFYEAFERFSIKLEGGTVQVFLHERDLGPIPANRLSDGTLRYLCLLTILCHPEPPPLICIEEPELGLHPDVIPVVAELLVEASQRTQLIVTTHSDILVSALNDVPDVVLVCERDGNGTHLRRLDPELLQDWLERYSLGDLWRMGELGGNRW